MVSQRLIFLSLAAISLVATPRAQVVFDNFNDSDVSDVFVFSQTGGGIGVGTTDGEDGTPDAALSVGLNPAETGTFAGFVITGGAGSTNVGATNYITFFIRPSTVQAGNLPITLELNVHEDINGNGAYEGATEDEFQALYRLDTGSDYQFVQIPLASFTDDNATFPGLDDGFDFSKLLEVVVAIGGPLGPEYAFAMDEIVFLATPLPTELVVAFDDFNDGDVSDVGVFSETGGGIGVGTTDGSDGTPNAALSVGVNPAEAGSFAGFVVPGGGGTTDVSSAENVVFQFRPSTVQAGNLPLVLELNLHEDVDGNGTYEGATEDEFQAVYSVRSGSDYVEVVIPLASFTDDNAVFPGLDNGFDFSKLLEIVVAFGGPQGPEFAFALDEIGFSTDIVVANESGSLDLPDSYVLSSAYPNPFNPQAQFNLTLERSQFVRIGLYDALGRQVERLYEGTLAAQIQHTFRIGSQSLPSGSYFYRVTGDDFSETRGVVLLK